MLVDMQIDLADSIQNTDKVNDEITLICNSFIC